MNNKSFTLIEILTVILIVGILSGVIIVATNNVIDSTQDAKRKKDLDSISKALMEYGVMTGSYPVEASECDIGDGTCLDELIDSGYAKGFPLDPSGDRYKYTSDGITYTIKATLSDNQTLAYNPDSGYSQYTGLVGYTKRKSITINSSAALTDYQVKIDVTYDSDMQADFDDLRFTLSNGTTELSHWLESKTDSVSAVFWVKVPSLSIGDNTIYAYYGNASASTGSNGDNTFEFFDGFEGSSVDTNKWEGHFDHISISNSIISLTYDSNIESLPSLSLTRPLILESRFKSSSNSYRTWITLSNETLSTDLGFDWQLLSSTCYSRGTNYVAIGTGYTDWNRYTTKWTTTNVLNYINGSLVQNHSGSPSENLEINVWAWTSGANPQLDWIAIRKYTATEPSISSWGTEEYI
ncbi:MAG: hypothetical protein MCSN_4390 [Candidatus Microsyncoccus archaeolyticus]|nr:MAG: hypothetical protein MCSN_4390 [Candidatus Parcubacteria bacterium]